MVVSGSDDVEQFKLTVEQLEVCRDLVLPDVAAKSRMALVLLDNVVEVILYRVTRETVHNDRFLSGIIEPRFSSKQRRDLAQLFEPKLKLVATDYHLGASAVAAVRVLHSYRNAAVHRDSHNPVAAPVLARMAFLAACELFAKTQAGVRTFMVGGDPDAVGWLARFGYNRSFLEFPAAARTIARELKKGVSIPVPRARRVLSNELLERLAEVRRVLFLELPLDGDVTRIDETLRRFEFEERFPDREFALSANHRELIYKIGAGLGDEIKPAAVAEAASVWRVQHEGEIKSFQGVTSSAALTKLAQAIRALPQSGGLASLLTAYASADRTLMWHERSVQAAFRAFEAALQLQADIARGK